MTDPPFFDPWRDPDDATSDEPDVDVPWTPPPHVSGVVVPVCVDVYRSQDTAVRVTHVVAYRRGVEVHVGAWVRPGTRRSLTSVAHVWEEQEPRVGFRLADGTRLGHRPPHGRLDPDAEEPTTTLSHTGGGGGGLSSASSWWLHPLPEGDTLEVVVRWDHRGVPESSARLDLAALRDAAEREDVLWDAPPPMPDHGHGYFGFSSPGGAPFTSSLSVSTDEPDAEHG